MRPLANKNASQCVERLLLRSCNAALGRLVNGRCGPFVLIDTRGGFRTLAASAKVPCQTGKSGHSSPSRPKPTCCAAHQGRLCAESGLCKVGGDARGGGRDQPRADLCTWRRGWPTPAPFADGSNTCRVEDAVGAKRKGHSPGNRHSSR